MIIPNSLNSIAITSELSNFSKLIARQAMLLSKKSKIPFGISDDYKAVSGHYPVSRFFNDKEVGIPAPQMLLAVRIHNGQSIQFRKINFILCDSSQQFESHMKDVSPLSSALDENLEHHHHGQELLANQKSQIWSSLFNKIKIAISLIIS